MFIDINKIGREGISFDHPLPNTDLGGQGAERITVTRGRISGQIAKREEEADLQAHLIASVGLVCSRCAEPFEARVEVEFFLTLVPAAAEFGSGDVKVEPEDATLYYTEDGKADLDSIAAEQIYLNLPLKPICREGCKGLCPQCGLNRNLGSCGCEIEAPDPRLASLLEFKKRR